MISERDSIQEALKVAQREPKPPGTPPSHLRCTWLKGDWDSPLPKQRCKLGDNHTGEHVYE